MRESKKRCRQASHPGEDRRRQNVKAGDANRLEAGLRNRGSRSRLCLGSSQICRFEQRPASENGSIGILLPMLAMGASHQDELGADFRDA
jgi:hypothetical protein